MNDIAQSQTKGEILTNASSEADFRYEMLKCMREEFDSEEEIEAIMDAIEIRSFKKGTVILRAGEIATKCYSILNGCIRQYYLVDGEEKTTFFYTEGDGIVSFTSAMKKIPANHYLSCVEDTTVSIILVEKELQLYKKYPRFESLSRTDMEKQLGDYQELLASYITSTPEERYLNLLKIRPDLLARVPQYHLASYLGIKPESLSRIRKRIMIK